MNNDSAAMARLIRIVLVSPGDVARERHVVKEVVDDVNTSCGRFFNILLELHRWEDIRPGLSKEGPQGQVDAHLGIEEADLVIGVFWRRFGTTIVTTSETGSEHEIRTAYRSWLSSSRPDIMLYFNRAGVDDENTQSMTQALRVGEFREEFQREGLVSDYLQLDEFQRKLRNHLTATVTQAAVASISSGHVACAMTAYPRPVRLEGATELIGEVRLTIAKQPSLERVVVDVEVFLNTNITNTIDQSLVLRETVLIVEPEHGGHQTREAVHGVLRNASTLTFESIELRSGGIEGFHTIRVLGIRANAGLLGGDEVLIFAKVKATSGPAISILNPQAVVGLCYPGLAAAIPRPPTFIIARGANPLFGTGNASTLRTDFEWVITETFPFAFKNRLEESVGGTYAGLTHDP